jgi:hypothetical protein
MLKMRIIAGFEVAEILMLTAGVLLVAAIVLAIWPLPPGKARVRPYQQLSGDDKSPNPRPAFLPDHRAQRHVSATIHCSRRIVRPEILSVAEGDSS